jgi:hypothetical protein
MPSANPSVLRRIAPALALLILSPVVAEFLLGDFSVRQIGLAFVFLAQYGAGALLVRELARRTGRGWPTMTLLALAYALIEEGFTTQTLFNPTYAGQRLLDYGYIPLLGTSFHFADFILTLHVVWSVLTCIAIAEGLAGPRWNTPWLGKIGLGVISVLYVLGCVFTVVITQKMFPYVASPKQFASVAVLVAIVVTSAFMLFRVRRQDNAGGAAPSPWLVGFACFVLSSAFYLLFGRGREHLWNTRATLAGMVTLQIVAIALFAMWSRRPAWTPVHVVAAAVGAVLTYGWLGIRTMARGSTNIGTPTTAFDVVGQIVLLAAVTAVAAIAVRRVRGV